jgi:Arc/MetJ-type ribon-helix-helix transcriptional regulator
MSETDKMAKQRLQIPLREDLVKWIDQEISKFRFVNKSHAIEYALVQLREKPSRKPRRKYELLDSSQSLTRKS